MIRLPINTSKIIKGIVIGNKKELSNLYGDYILNDLEVVSPQKKVIVTEYQDGQIIYSFMED